MVRFLSVCSGIEAASVAWNPLGWHAVAFSEIDPFPCAVLDHHYPDVPNLGDMTKFKDWPDVSIDLLCGGTPCQSFSVAGLRKGLDDPRGNLMLTFGAIAGRYRPRWLVWENVPGVLSSNGGRDFGAFLGMLGQLGYGVAYRVLDAQYFGVAQRRRRVFVVGYLGDWRRAAAVLFERHSLSGDSAPSREARESFTHDVAPCLTSSGRGVERIGETRGQDPVIAQCLTTGTGQRYDPETETILPVAFTLKLPSASGGGQPAACMTPQMAVRRLTPRECERLQGFPDNYTLVPHRGKPAADGPRYKALGNSWAVPVARWVGERIEQVESLEVA
ncbi:MAG: DNA cytosine methyltransferase [Burkholderiaceae bacterium]